MKFFCILYFAQTSFEPGVKLTHTESITIRLPQISKTHKTENISDTYCELTYSQKVIEVNDHINSCFT